jgi:hypothetical protein
VFTVSTLRNGLFQQPAKGRDPEAKKFQNRSTAAGATTLAIMICVEFLDWLIARLCCHLFDGRTPRPVTRYSGGAGFRKMTRASVKFRSPTKVFEDRVHTGLQDAGR